MAVFGKSKAGIHQQTISTFLSAGTVVGGGLKAPAYARIDGSITGDVEVAEGLILGENAQINGNVSTGELVIYGTINGNINVRSIEIGATGKVSGDIVTNALAVETGGIYNGRLVMNTKA